MYGYKGLLQNVKTLCNACIQNTQVEQRKKGTSKTESKQSEKLWNVYKTNDLLHLTCCTELAKSFLHRLISLAGAATSIIFVAKKCVCHDKHCSCRDKVVWRDKSLHRRVSKLHFGVKYCAAAHRQFYVGGNLSALNIYFSICVVFICFVVVFCWK